MRNIVFIFFITLLSFDISKTDSIALRVDLQPYTIEHNTAGISSTLPFSSIAAAIGYSIKF